MDENNSLLFSQKTFEDRENLRTINDEDEDDDDVLTSQELFQRLQDAWLNEKYSPILLKHENLLVLATFELLDDIEKRLKSSEHKTTSFRWLMHRTEYNRLYFILCSYIRTRCWKIEEFPSAALNNGELLSPEECVYAETYLNNMKDHLKKSVLVDLKSEQQQQQEANEKNLLQLLPKPNLNEFVFFQADQSVQGLILSNEQSNNGPMDVIDLKTGDQLIMQFKHIHKILMEKQIHLTEIERTMTSPLDTLKSADVQDLICDKYILILGDSVIRGLYKDLIKFFQNDSLSNEDELYAKGEKRFFGDQIIHGGVEKGLNNANDYEEAREYTGGGRVRIRFYFLTRSYSTYMKRVIFNDIENQAIKPDVVIMNSCLWDVTRYGNNPMKSYQTNLDQMFANFRQILPKETLFLWLSALPASNSSKTTIISSSTEYMRLILPGLIRDANFHCSKLCDTHQILYIDLHTTFSHMLHLRLADGVHWDAIAIRMVNEMILHHIQAYYSGVQRFQCVFLREQLTQKMSKYKHRIKTSSSTKIESSQIKNGESLSKEVSLKMVTTETNNTLRTSAQVKRPREIIETNKEKRLQPKTKIIKVESKEMIKVSINSNSKSPVVCTTSDKIREKESETLSFSLATLSDSKKTDDEKDPMLLTRKIQFQVNPILPATSQLLIKPKEETREINEPDYIVVSSDDDENNNDENLNQHDSNVVLPIYLLIRQK